MQSEIAIVGAGFSGTLVALHVARSAAAPSVLLFEREHEYGRGLAYSTRTPRHLLNVRANNISAFEDDPEHFVRWLRGRFEPDDFVPRNVYGAYLGELAREARESGYVDAHMETIVDVEPAAGGYRLTAASGAAYEAQHVVLALGNFPPSDAFLPAALRTSERYYRNPWRFDPRSVQGDVLAIGSGLTMLDVLLSLEDAQWHASMHTVSRHGFFPNVHRPAPVKTIAPFASTGMRELLREVRMHVREAQRSGTDWRSVIDAMRPHLATMWHGLEVSERRRFLRHVRAFWEVHRHRVAAAVDRVRERRLAAGTLSVHRGRVAAAREEGDELVVRVEHHDGTSTEVHACAVVNCTGPQSNYAAIDDPLVRNLIARGLLVPDPIRLGVRATTSGNLIGANGPLANLWTLGPPLHGLWYETTAVPELRGQTKRLAEQLVAAL